MFNTSRGRALQDGACVLAQGKRLGCRGARAGSRGMRDVGIGQFRRTEEPPAPRSSGGIVPRCHRRRIPIRLLAHEGKNKAAGDSFRLILRRKKARIGSGELRVPPRRWGCPRRRQQSPEGHGHPTQHPWGTAATKSIRSRTRGVEHQGRSPAAPTQHGSWSQPTSRGGRILQHTKAAGTGRTLLARGGFCTPAPPCRNNSLSLCLLTFNINSVQVSRGQIGYRHFAFI